VADLHAHKWVSANDAPMGSHPPSAMLGIHVIQANIEISQLEPTLKFNLEVDAFFVCTSVSVTVL
jgi:hypothetical protein